MFFQNCCIYFLRAEGPCFPAKTAFHVHATRQGDFLLLLQLIPFKENFGHFHVGVVIDWFGDLQCWDFVEICPFFAEIWHRKLLEKFPIVVVLESEEFLERKFISIAKFW